MTVMVSFALKTVQRRLSVEEPVKAAEQIINNFLQNAFVLNKERINFEFR